MSARFLPRLFLLAAVAFSGCVSASSEQLQAMKAASDRYAAISRTMTRDEIVALLGPAQQSSAQQLVWETRSNFSNYEILAVSFGPDGRVTRLTHTTKRYSSSPLWEFGRHSTVER